MSPGLRGARSGRRAGMLPARAIVAASARHQRRRRIRALEGLGAWRSSSSNSTRPAKSKLVSSTRSPLREAGGGPQAEAARLDAIDSAVRAQRLHALLGQRIHRALVVTQRRENAVFAFEENRDVGAQAPLRHVLRRPRRCRRPCECAGHRRASGPPMLTRTPYSCFFPDGRGPPSHCICASFQSRSRSTAPRMRARR